MTRPPIVVMAAGLLHVVWGLVVWLGVADLRPALVMAWFGTTAMLLIAALVVGSQGWPSAQLWVFPALLVFDVGAAGLVVLSS